jgi:xanthine dehydrogenase accessory factor
VITSSVGLVDFFSVHRKRDEPLVLATIIETIGSTYRKAGTQMLIARDGQAAGLLSGGCAESDLIERAQRVFASGKSEIATFDTRGSDDVIWGIGLGCEGAMRILLSRIDNTNQYQPFAYSVKCKLEQREGAIAFAISGSQWELGQSWNLDSGGHPDYLRAAMTSTIRDKSTLTITVPDAKSDAHIFVAPIELPARLLILGAGADAAPVATLAAQLGWQVTIADHRPAYAVQARFERARVILSPAAELPKAIQFADFDAAVVMSHHLVTDQIYLASLAESNVRYVGLLGPANRRKRLLAEIGERAVLLAGRLAGPVGLDIGAKSPEAIALAIIAEIHAHLEHRTGSSFSGLLAASNLPPPNE